MRKERKVAALLAVKEDSHVKWYIFFADKNGEFVSLGMADSGSGFNGLLAALRLGTAEETRVRHEVGALPAEFKVGGGDTRGQIISGSDACLLMPALLKRLGKMAACGTEEERYLPGEKFYLICPNFTAVIYGPHFITQEMNFLEKLQLGLRPFLPATA